MIREHHCSRIDAWLRSHGHFASTAINDSRLLVCTKTRSATCAPVRPPASPCQRTAVLPYVQRPPSFASCKRLLTKYFMEPLTLFTGSRKAKVRTGTVLSPRGPNVRILTQRPASSRPRTPGIWAWAAAQRWKQVFSIPPSSHSVSLTSRPLGRFACETA
jgi:hypothetical protein